MEKEKKFFNELVGLDIREVAKKLRKSWYVLEYSHNNKHTFRRSPNAIVELNTDNNNIVISEYHNFMAEVMEELVIV